VVNILSARDVEKELLFSTVERISGAGIATISVIHLNWKGQPSGCRGKHENWPIRLRVKIKTTMGFHPSSLTNTERNTSDKNKNMTAFYERPGHMLHT